MKGLSVLSEETPALAVQGGLVLVSCLTTNIYSQNFKGNKKPNVIIVITDDQGKGDLGCYGNNVIKTPTLDSFYADAVRLDNFHVSPTCAPTRGALLTGKHTNRLNVFHTIAGRSLLFPDEVIMPEVFASNGYSTGMFGKWHLGDNHPLRPEDRGFEVVVRHGGGGISQGPDFWGNDYFDDTYWTHTKNSKKTVTKPYKGYCTDVFFEEALRFIDNNKNDPFFLYISTNAPHGPLNVPQKYLDIYKNDNRITKKQQRFYGMITNIDDNFQKLENKLDFHGLTDNTILIFMTDNGTAAGKTTIKNGITYGHSAGLRASKGSPYEGGHRVPFMIRWPNGKINGGKDIDELTAHYDILPTLAELLQFKFRPRGNLDGKSLVPLLYNKKVDWADRTLFVDSQQMQNLVKYRNYAVMNGDWRLVNGIELYNLSNDLGQEKNVINDFPEKAAVLSTFYEKLSLPSESRNFKIA